MNDKNNIISLIVVSLISLVGYLLKVYLISPTLRVRDVIARISYALTYYANVLPLGKNSIGEEIMAKEIVIAQEELRKLAAELRSTRDTMQLYYLASHLRLIPKWEQTEDAATSLIGWSNYVYETGVEGSRGRHQFREKIAKALNIPKY